MNILIIGGTRFLGRHLVESAMARGHEVTLFNRGLTNPDLFPEVETILGDREKDLLLLLGDDWDAVIDTCGYVPRIVHLSAEALESLAHRYVFISSISVYAGFTRVGMGESDPVDTIEAESEEEITEETFGPLKALCEKVVQKTFGADRSLVIRPGLIVGPYDPTDRFTYWPVRVARGGEVLAPEGPEAPIQIIDVRDLSDFTIRLIEDHASGTFNATGPDHPLTMGTLLETCKHISGSDAEFKWAPVDFLVRHEVTPWGDMPVWIPNRGKDAGFSHMDVSKAVNAGLTFRPLEETVRDTLEWVRRRHPDRELRSGISREKEAELLAVLKEE